MIRHERVDDKGFDANSAMGPGAAVLNNVLYAVGGNTGTDIVATLEAYDPARTHGRPIRRCRRDEPGWVQAL